jgi:hypothetical protein
MEFVFFTLGELKMLLRLFALHPFESVLRERVPFGVGRRGGGGLLMKGLILNLLGKHNPLMLPGLKT